MWRTPLPKYGYYFPVRVCRRCFDDVKSSEESLFLKGSAPSVGVILTGYVKEQTKLSQWAPRQLVLTNAALHIFRPLEGTLLGEEKGHIMLDKIASVEEVNADSKSPNLRNCFQIRTTTNGRKPQTFSVEHPKQCLEWVSSIKLAKEGSAKAVYLSTK